MKPVFEKMAENRRAELLDGLRRFVLAVRDVAGVRSISLVGSIVTAKPDPKDIDVLLIVSDDADLAALAIHARRLQGHAQTFNRGADVFLADERGDYLGRTCRWRDCRPGIRQSCGALHCGTRPHLHDDLDAIALSKDLIAAPPLTLWPAVERRTQLPPDLEEFVAVTKAPAGTELTRPFLPARNFELSKRFYEALGFATVLDASDIAIFRMGRAEFLLQSYYQKDWAENFMMQLMVDDLDAWWSHIQSLDLSARFGVAAPKAPALQPWGLRIAYVTDPSGVLWHVAQRRPGVRHD